MKNIFKKAGFQFRFAFRNIVKDYLNSILIFFNFLIVFIFIMLTLSVEPLMTSYFLGSLESKYNDIDMTMSVNYNSQTRYFSIRHLRDSSIKDDIAHQYAPFFEIDTIIETKTNVLTYVKVMASEIEHFYQIADIKEGNLNIIEDHEIIVTKSFAKRHNIDLNDELTLYLGSENKVYQVLAILEDRGLFQDDTVFVSKQGSIRLFLSTINPALSQFSPQFFMNFYNKVYIDLKPEVSISEATQWIQNISQYQDLDFQETINYQSVNQLISRATIVFYVMAAIIMFALLLILQTTFMLIFNQKKKVFSITQVIGGRQSFMFISLSLEMFIYFVFAIIVAIPISIVIIENGIQYIDQSIVFKFGISEIVISVLVSFVLFFTALVYYFYRFNRRSLVQQMKKEGDEKKLSIVTLSIIFMTSLTLFVLSRNGFFKTYLGDNLVFFDVAIILVLMFSMAFLLSYIIITLQARIKTNSLILSMKTITNKNAYKYYVSVMLVSILSLFLIFGANFHIQRKTEILKEEQHFDFLILNTLNRYQVIYDQINLLDHVEEAQLAIYYQNIEMMNQELTLNTLLGIDAYEIANYFGYQIDESFLETLNSYEDLVMILPYRFQELHHFDIGDNIEFNINEQVLSFRLIGFFDKEIGSKAFTNLHLFKDQYNLIPNAILVNGDEEKDELYFTLITMFSQYLVYTVDFQHELNEQIVIMENANNYLVYINIIMILFFLIAVIIHTLLLFEQMKETYAKFMMLGISQKRMFLLLIKENIYIFSIIFISSLFGFLSLYEQIPQLVLAFGEFEKLHFSNHVLMQSIFASLAFVFLTKIFYTLKAMKYDIISTLKYYE
jgi:putative ABC transport system permease protein